MVEELNSLHDAISLKHHIKGRPRFSVLIPCYNSQDYLEDCIISVVKQTFESWEIIVIDDGSNDDSPLILDVFEEYLKGNFKVIHRENCGSLSSRIFAASLARGEYAIYLDADDTLRSDCLEILDDCVRRFPNSLINIKYSRRPDFSRPWFPKYPSSDSNIIEVDSLWLKRQICTDSSFNYIWAKAIHLDEIQFNDLSNYAKVTNAEDLMQLTCLLEQISSVVLLDDALYFYRPNPNGMSKAYNASYFDSIKTANSYLYERIKYWDDSDCLLRFYRRWLNVVYSAIFKMLREIDSKDEALSLLNRIARDNLFIEAWKHKPMIPIRQRLMLTLLVRGKFNLLLAASKIS